MTEKEREILRLMYELQLELHSRQTDQIAGLEQAVQGALKAVTSLERAHEILGRLLKATGELMGVH